MIQRIQSLYMLLTSAILACAVFLPLAHFVIGGSQFTLGAFAFVSVEGAYHQSTVYMGLLLSLTALLPLVALFLYNHRLTQVRLLGAEAVLLLGDVAFMVIYYLLSQRAFGDTMTVVSKVGWVAVAPAVGFILTLLAIRGVMRDELLVRSLDRIR